MASFLYTASFVSSFGVDDTIDERERKRKQPRVGFLSTGSDDLEESTPRLELFSCFFNDSISLSMEEKAFSVASKPVISNTLSENTIYSCRNFYRAIMDNIRKRNLFQAKLIADAGIPNELGEWLQQGMPHYDDKGNLQYTGKDELSDYLLRYIRSAAIIGKDKAQFVLGNLQTGTLRAQSVNFRAIELDPSYRDEEDLLNDLYSKLVTWKDQSNRKDASPIRALDRAFQRLQDELNLKLFSKDFFKNIQTHIGSSTKYIMFDSVQEIDYFIYQCEAVSRFATQTFTSDDYIFLKNAVNTYIGRKSAAGIPGFYSLDSYHNSQDSDWVLIRALHKTFINQFQKWISFRDLGMNYFDFSRDFMSGKFRENAMESTLFNPMTVGIMEANCKKYLAGINLDEAIAAIGAWRISYQDQSLWSKDPSQYSKEEAIVVKLMNLYKLQEGKNIGIKKLSRLIAKNDWFFDNILNQERAFKESEMWVITRKIYSTFALTPYAAQMIDIMRDLGNYRSEGNYLDWIYSKYTKPGRHIGYDSNGYPNFWHYPMFKKLLREKCLTQSAGFDMLGEDLTGISPSLIDLHHIRFNPRDCRFSNILPALDSSHTKITNLYYKSGLTQDAIDIGVKVKEAFERGKAPDLIILNERRYWEPAVRKAFSDKLIRLRQSNLDYYLTWVNRKTFPS